MTPLLDVDARPPNWAKQVVRFREAVALPHGCDTHRWRRDDDVLLPRRWVVERTFAWLGRYRRLSMDYEALPGTDEAWIYLAMFRLMLARLTR